MTFIQHFEKSFRENFNFPALSDFGTNVNYTYGALAKEIAKPHILFEEYGLKAGDKISLIGKNTTNWGIVHTATFTPCSAKALCLRRTNRKRPRLSKNRILYRVLLK